MKYILFVLIYLLYASFAFGVESIDSFDKLIEMQEKRIEDINSTISLAQNQNDEAVLDLYNEKGLIYFFLGKYDLALNEFNHVLNILFFNQRIQSRVFGTALWGRLFTHAYSNCEREAFEDIYLVHSYFIHNNSPCYMKASILSPRIHDRCRLVLVADFQNPNERISPGECKERVRGTANVMRLLAVKIPNAILGAAVQYTISELESAAYNCCDRCHWTDCLDPIVDAWKYLKNCLDKGLTIAPRLVGPGRY